jgi:glycosyltransferase involved in cell wall biosynthesis
MKILHVNKFLYRRGGAEGYMQDVAARQAAQGHEVAFFGMAHPDNDPQRYADTFPTEVEFEPAPESATGKLRALGRMVWSTSAQRGIASVLDDFRPDVVHLHNIYHQLSPSVLRPVAARGIPAVMTLHDYKLVCPTYQFLDKGQICQACVSGGFSQAVRRRCKDGSLTASAAAALELSLHTRFGAYDPVRLFLCPSRFLADQMRRGGVFPERMTVLNNFVDSDAVTPQEGPGSGIVFAGRLSREKGVDVLVRAVAELAPDLPAGPILQVAGDGPVRAELEALAADLAPGRVVFTGRLPMAALGDLVRGAAVAAVPSRWHENQPLAILEAFACGLPVVTTDLGGLPELVDDGVDGALVRPDDAPALAAARRPLLTDPVRAHRMGRAGRAKVVRDFAPDDHVRTLLDRYAQAAAQGDVRTDSDTHSDRDQEVVGA